jgi:hypothetical protein
VEKLDATKCGYNESHMSCTLRALYLAQQYLDNLLRTTSTQVLRHNDNIGHEIFFPQLLLLQLFIILTFDTNRPRP